MEEKLARGREVGVFETMSPPSNASESLMTELRGTVGDKDTRTLCSTDVLVDSEVTKETDRACYIDVKTEHINKYVCPFCFCTFLPSIIPKVLRPNRTTVDSVPKAAISALGLKR